MLVVGLTGGIGSGKTTVANLFAELGAPIIDTDVIAREVVEPGTDALEQIKNKLGVDVINTNGRLNRQKMRDQVFSNPELKEWLESLLHPLIRTQVAQQISQVNHPYCIVVIPLLAETGPNPVVQRVLVVDCAEQTQIDRASGRDDNSVEQIKNIMAKQVSRSQRLAIADDVINNDKGLDELKTQTADLNKKYLESTR